MRLQAAVRVRLAALASHVAYVLATPNDSPSHAAQVDDLFRGSTWMHRGRVPQRIIRGRCCQVESHPRVRIERYIDIRSGSLERLCQFDAIGPPARSRPSPR